MYFQQFYLGCLSHASYVIGSDGIAAVIDPQRDVGIYIEDAVKHGFTHPACDRDPSPRRFHLRPRRTRRPHRRHDLPRRAGRRQVSARPGSRWRRSPLRQLRFALPRNARPHPGEHLDPGHRYRTFARAVRRAHRRHAVHRRRRASRPLSQSHSAATRRPALRQPAHQAADAARSRSRFIPPTAPARSAAAR